MIIQEIVYQFKIQAEVIDSKKSPDLDLPKIIIILNSAMLNLTKMKYGINNRMRQGFESTEKRIQDLQRLHVLDEQLAPIAGDKLIYRFDLLKTKKPFLYMTRTRFTATKCGCEDTLKGFDPQTDDLNLIQEGEFTTPSFEWRETNYRVADDKIHAESDGTFAITKALIDYLRYPVQMDMEGYEHFDESLSTDIQCELPDYLHQEIVDEAALEFKLWTENPAYQFAQLKEATTE